MRLPKYKYLAVMIDKEGNIIRRVFGDTEKALQFALTHGYQLKAIRRLDYWLKHEEQRKTSLVVREVENANQGQIYSTSQTGDMSCYYPLISIIVPCKTIGFYERQCIEECLKLNYPNFELLILPDQLEGINPQNPRVQVLPTGNVSPSMKRSIGLSKSRGEVVAFLDSDAYPSPQWLRNAVNLLSMDSNIAAVGGPTLTPKEDSILQKASGLVLSSNLGAGTISFRYLPKGIREVDDLPTCNLILRRKALERLASGVRNYWPGEDTLLCMGIREELGMKIVYSPDIIVYHHRRPLFKAHLRQIWSYGLHRGYFAKKFPKNSRKPIYFLPSFLVLLMGLGLLAALMVPSLSLPYIVLISSYLVACLYEGARTRNRKMILLVPVGIILTHIVYGLAFMKGIITPKLKEDRS